MPAGQVLEFSGVTKRFRSVTAVSGFSARVEPGVVTGFLGPNGAGKTTSLRILLGLVRPTAGTATIGGVPYARLRSPLRSVGAVLEASSFHPGRTAANHLRILAKAGDLPLTRIGEVLATVGLTDAANSRVGGFSLGMRQRLALASALLGDPGVLILDEPTNGLDPEGIKWMRGLLRDLAAQGRTILVSSHLLAEVQQTVDALLVIASGRLVYQGGLENLADVDDYATVVDSPDRPALAAALDAAGIGFDVLRSGYTIRGSDPTRVGAIAAAAGVALSTLQLRGPSLEEVFLDLVSGARVHPSAGAAVAADPNGTDAAAPAESGEPVRIAAETDHPGGEADLFSSGETVNDPAPGAAYGDEEGTVGPLPDEDEPVDTDIEVDPQPPPAPSWAVQPDPVEVGTEGRSEHPKSDSDVAADAFFASYDGRRDDPEPTESEESGR